MDLYKQIFEALNIPSESISSISKSGKIFNILFTDNTVSSYTIDDVFRLLLKNTIKVSPNDKPLTEAEATKLKTDIINKDFAPKINLLLAHEIAQGKVNQNMFDAIISLAYNIGTNAFAKSSVLRNLKAGNKQAAADSFLAWNKAGGKVLKGLVNRRQAERKLFLS
jgi:GH24 family phage-related lysozyme (muramidase)